MKKNKSLSKKEQIAKTVEAEEFAFLMQQAKTQHELQGIVKQMQAVESEQKAQTKATADLESQLRENIEETQAQRLSELENDVTENAIKYDASPQTNNHAQNAFEEKGNPNLYEHDDMYKGEEYVPSVEREEVEKQTGSKIDTRVFKSEIDKIVDKTTDLYTRNK